MFEIFEKESRLKVVDSNFKLVAELLLDLVKSVSGIGPCLNTGDLLGGKGFGAAHQVVTSLPLNTLHQTNPLS